MIKILALLFMLYSVPASAEMKAIEIPLKAVCWDSIKEAIDFHKETLGEYPLVKKYTNHHTIGEGGGILMVKPDRTSWTFLAFRKNKETHRTVVCAFFEGQKWEIVITPPTEPSNKIEL